MAKQKENSGEVKVEVIESFGGSEYSPSKGEILTVPQEIANDWIKHNLAKEVK